jgi:hypothetical protein
MGQFEDSRESLALMEKEFFSWTNWCDYGGGVFQFNGCIIKKKLGKYEPGSRVECITINMDTGAYRVYESGETVSTIGKFKLVEV